MQLQKCRHGRTCTFFIVIDIYIYLCRCKNGRFVQNFVQSARFLYKPPFFHITLKLRGPGISSFEFRGFRAGKIDSDRPLSLQALFNFFCIYIFDIYAGALYKIFMRALCTNIFIKMSKNWPKIAKNGQFGQFLWASQANKCVGTRFALKGIRFISNKGAL